MNKKNDNPGWSSIKISSKIEPKLYKNSLIVLEKRYLSKDNTGKVNETPRELFERVAKYIAHADFAYGKSADDVARTANSFYEIMARLQFLPNSPTLMNAGRTLGQLSACFVLPVEDTMVDIFESVKQMALIHKSGGGTGFSFSKLRPKNDFVSSTAGISSGPISFMNIFNAATETVKQGGTRRGANMAILRVDHPDIVEFISSKEDSSSLTNFNISVALTDEFIGALDKDGDYELKNPRNGNPVKKVKARDIFNLIVKKAWHNGEPGIVFIDRINEYNPLKKIGLIESTNPCGEQPLLPYESCNLGSINLNTILAGKNGEFSIDYDILREITRTSVHFLDNVIDVNNYPLEIIKEKTTCNRKIGLGVMGFADLLIRLNIPYNSDAAIAVAAEIMSAIQDESKKVSMELAAERGAFPNFEKSEYFASGKKPLRNATTTTIAPTGTISIIANSSSGIEPIFALAYVRNVMDNNVLVETNPLFEETAREKKFFTDAVINQVAEHGSLSGIEEIPEDIKNVFVTAHEVSPEFHIRIQAEFQKYVDNAVSKTVNFANDATIEDIEQVYTLAYKLGCKGVTVYRDGSRDEQVLETKSSQKSKKAGPETTETAAQMHPSPRSRGITNFGSTRKMATGCGSLYVTINEDDKGLFEVFATMGKSGGCAASQTEAVSRLISLSLRCGIDKNQIIKQLKGVRCPNQAWEKGGKIYSCSDAIAKAIERHSGLNLVAMESADPMDSAKSTAETNGKGNDIVMVGVCPDCHGPLEYESGCSVCRSCGYSKCG